MDFRNNNYHHSSKAPFPAEPHKLAAAMAILFLSYLASWTALVLVHESVPHTPPLPDLVLDRLALREAAADLADVLVMLASPIAVVTFIMHKHRFIVLRRLFFIQSLSFFFRSLCVVVTALPVTEKYHCAPKMGDNFSLGGLLGRVYQMGSVGGLQVNSDSTAQFCGDFLYSGHTVGMVTMYLFIKEYTPPTWRLLHWAFLCMAAVDVACLFLGKEHYTVDVVLGYWVGTRLFWIFHTLVNDEELMLGSDQTSLHTKRRRNTYLTNCYWFPVLRYLEGGLEGRQVPREVSLSPREVAAGLAEDLAPALDLLLRRRAGK